MKKIILLIAVFCWIFKNTSGQSIVPDLSFGINGLVKTDLGKPYNYFYNTAGIKALLGTDGSIFDILAVADKTLITKRDPDGSVKLSYNKNGFSETANISALDAVMQQDGKIIVAGSVSKDPYGGLFALLRYNADGSIDKSFGTNGTQTTDFGGSAYEFATSLALQSNGKIVAAGYS